MSGFRLRATAPEEADRIREFLAGVFRMSIDAPAFEPRLIHWKYYRPRPDWNGSRSFVLERDGEIVSHGCVWPMPFVTPSGIVPACQIIDWAASPTVPGSGLLLRREIEKLVSVSVAIGGSPDSLKVIPRSGYATAAQFRKFVRVVRPFRQFLHRREPELWKRIGKSARNALWSLTPVPEPPEGWSAAPLGRVSNAPGAGYAGTSRSPELYRYLLDCPSGHASAFGLKKSGVDAGFFLLNEVDGQTRIADLQVNSGAAADWRAAVIVATSCAAAIPETYEIVASTSFGRFAEALRDSGYRPCGEQPVFLLDRSKALAGMELHITPADYDDFFARFPDSPFAA